MDAQREWDAKRAAMVRYQLEARGIEDARVLSAMSRVPRHEFVPEEFRSVAYTDTPLPIGEGQTISQPYIVGLMTQALELAGGERVLELGTGSGYQAAVLAEMGADVWTVERLASLAQSAQARLQRLGYEAVHCRISDGTLGYPERAPFHRIVATGSLPAIPQDLLRQLVPGGIFVGPVGDRYDQDLLRIVYHPAGCEQATLCLCRFVPLIGKKGWQSEWRAGTGCEERP